MNYATKVLDREFIVSLTDRGESVSIEVDGKPAELMFTTRKNKHRFLLVIDNRSYDVEVNRSNGRFSVFIYGREFEVTAEDERLARIREVAGMGVEGDAEKEINAPMPGLVVDVLKKKGDQVSKGEGVIVIEAMKMENELKAEADGVIEDIIVEVGQSVEKGACLVKLQ